MYHPVYHDPVKKVSILQLQSEKKMGIGDLGTWLRLFGIICWALTFYFAPMVFGLPVVIADISLGAYLPSDKRKEEGGKSCCKWRTAGRQADEGLDFGLFLLLLSLLLSFSFVSPSLFPLLPSRLSSFSPPAR